MCLGRRVRALHFGLSMPNLFTRVEAAVLNPLRRPALSGVAEHGTFWSSAVFLVLILLRLVPGFVGMFGGFWLVFVVPVWVVFSCIILYRWLVNHVLWKVRNRLVVTYLLMGLTPVVLFVTLAGIASYVFSGNSPPSPQPLNWRQPSAASARRIRLSPCM